MNDSYNQKDSNNQVRHHTPAEIADSITYDFLKGVPLGNLVDLQSRLEKVIIELKDEQKLRLFQNLITQANDYGLSLEDVKNMRIKDILNKATPKKYKYQNPNNPDQKWTGKGATPKWIKESGQDKSAFEVKTKVTA